MHFNLANEAESIGPFQGEPLRGFYERPIQQIIDYPEVLARITGHHYVYKVAGMGSFADISSINLHIAKLATQVSARAAISEQWRRLVLDPGAPADVDSLTETVESTLDYVAEFGPGALDLSGLNPAGVQCEHLASVLRATSFWQDEVPGWHQALVVAQEACEQAGQDADDVLFGMI